MRIRAAAMVFTVFLAASASAEEPVTVLSKSPVLLEAGTGDAFVRFSAAEPAKLLLRGPARFQADVRVNLPAGASTPPSAAIISVLASGKPLGSLRVQPRPGSKAWTNDKTILPSASIGFFVEVDAGAHPYEFRIDAISTGAALLLAPAEKARTPLAATAPVVPARLAAAPAKAVATPAAVAAATLASTATRIDDLKVEAPDWSTLDLARVSAVGAGLDLATGPSDPAKAVPFFGYRLWFTNRLGMGARLGLSSRSGESTVASSPDGEPGTEARIAAGQGYDLDLALTGFWNVQRAQRTALFLYAGAGPVLHKEIRRELETGALGQAGFGVELAPQSMRSVGFTLQGGFRVLSFPSERLGTSVDPVVTGTFHYYLNRSSNR